MTSCESRDVSSEREKKDNYVVSQAFIIALTSDYILRLVYEMRYSENEADPLAGYVNYTLSYFNTSDFEVGHGPGAALRGDVQICR